MKINKRKLHITNFHGFYFTILLIVIILAEFFLFLIVKPVANKETTIQFIPVKTSGSVKKFKQIWTKAINDYGTKKAHDLMLKTYDKTDFKNQHTAAHLFGELLYEAVGVSGLNICDKNYNFGCYHGFIGRAIGNEGIKIVGDLDKVCLKEFGPYGLGCVHGIGHGLTEYFGHDVAKIDKALEICKSLAWKGTINGCSSGVFMEYNQPALLSIEKNVLGIRHFDPNNPYSQCPKLSIYKESCYYELANWWQNSYSDDFKKLGELCEKLQDNDSKKYCYLGVGDIIPPSKDYNLEKVYESCSLMPTRQGEVYCRAAASWGMFTNEPTRHLSKVVCQTGLTPAERKYCSTESNYMNLISGQK